MYRCIPILSPNRFGSQSFNASCHVLSKDRQRVLLVCRGVAALLKLKTSGRRNMLGSIAPRRGDAYFASTAALLAIATRSNSNVQIPYRLPITERTHDPDCKLAGCLGSVSSQQLCKIAQRAMKQMSGYFGGYISKKQRIGQYELKKSVGALPLMLQKLSSRKLSSGSHQLSHVVNRMFTTLESKGILRTGTEEMALSAKFHATDKLAAEFVRTCREETFPGRKFLERVEGIAAQADKIEVNILLPAAARATPPLDVVSVYGFRPQHPALWYLSPFEFVQWFIVHKLRAPGKDYALTMLTAEGRAKRKEGSSDLVVCEDFVPNEKVIGQQPHLFMLPQCSAIFAGPPRVHYEKLRSSWLIVRRGSPVVPCPTNTVMPRRNMSKHQRAKLCSVYLRSWTLCAKLGSCDVPFAGDLGLGTSDSVGTVRAKWKQYLQAVWPHSVRTIRNFVSNSLAESHRDGEDEGDTRGTAMTCVLTLQDVEKVLSGERSVRLSCAEQSQLSKESFFLLPES